MWKPVCRVNAHYYSTNCFYLNNIVSTHHENLFCVRLLNQLFQVPCQTITFCSFFIQQSTATRHVFQLNNKRYRVRHILRRRTPVPLGLNLPLTDFGEYENFFLVLGPVSVSWTLVLQLNWVGSLFLKNLQQLLSRYLNSYFFWNLLLFFFS